MVNERWLQQKQFTIPNRAAVIASSLARDLPLASHDDTEIEHVEQASAEGMAIVMGGPNLVKGGSHSGNVSAAELAQLDLLDIFSSDYVVGHAKFDFQKAPCTA